MFEKNNWQRKKVDGCGERQSYSLSICREAGQLMLIWLHQCGRMHLLEGTLYHVSVMSGWVTWSEHGPVRHIVGPVRLTKGKSQVSQAAVLNSASHLIKGVS